MQIAAIIAPTKAIGVIRYSIAGNNTITKIPVSPAPEEIPMICGSAKGFFITACKIAPAIAKFIPTNPATIVLGNLILYKICW